MEQIPQQLQTNPKPRFFVLQVIILVLFIWDFFFKVKDLVFTRYWVDGIIFALEVFIFATFIIEMVGFKSGAAWSKKAQAAFFILSSLGLAVLLVFFMMVIAALGQFH